MLFRKIRHLQTIHFRNVTDAAITASNTTHQSPIINTFYTVHTAAGTLLYISEVVPSDNNPDFQTISLPKLHNESAIEVALFASRGDSNHWDKLVNYAIDLNQDLVPLPKQTETQPLLPNAVILNFSDGWWYTAKECVETIVPTKPEPSHHPYKTSYTFDSIRSLNSIYKSIIELVSIKNKLSAQIDRAIDATPSSAAAATPPTALDLPERLVTKQKLVNDTVSSQIMNRKVAINEIRSFVSEQATATESISHQIEFIDTHFEPLQESLVSAVYPEILKQIKQYTTVISDVFYIENVNNSIKFKIQGVEFPSTIKQLLDLCYYSEDPGAVVKINAALSYIAQAVLALSAITRTNLKYKIHWQEDKCFLTEQTPTEALDFPLYYSPETNEKVVSKDKNCLRKYTLRNAKFEFGLYLLNRDIMILLHSANELFQTCSTKGTKGTKYENDLQLNIPLDCLDNFLWNLQYLILYLTSVE